MPLEPGFIEANILIYAANMDERQHAASRRLLEAALDPTVTLYVTPQVHCEFYSVITNPKRIATAFTAAQATQIIIELLEMPRVRTLARERNLFVAG